MPEAPDFHDKGVQFLTWLPAKAVGLSAVFCLPPSGFWGEAYKSSKKEKV